MEGSWPLKAVLPAIAPDLSYTALGEVQDGTGAQAAYLEAIELDTLAGRDTGSAGKRWSTSGAPPWTSLPFEKGQLSEDPVIVFEGEGINCLDLLSLHNKQ